VQKLRIEWASRQFGVIRDEFRSVWKDVIGGGIAPRFAVYRRVRTGPIPQIRALGTTGQQRQGICNAGLWRGMAEGDVQGSRR
jgi:hypothetical protein